MKYWKRLAAGFFIFFSSTFFFGAEAFANGNAPAEQWVIDPQSRLSLPILSHLNLMLRETASRQGIYIRVFIIHDKSAQSIDVQSLETIQAWEAANFYKSSHQSGGYLVINTYTGYGKVLLKSNNTHSQYLVEGLRNLESYGIGSALLEGDLEKAIFQGVIGLSTLLKEPPVVKPQNLIERLISLYRSSALFHFLVLMMFFGAIGAAVVIYLRTPVASKEPNVEAKEVYEV